MASLLAACSTTVQPSATRKTADIHKCMPGGSAVGRLTLFEYSNFWPTKCPGVAFGVERFGSAEASDIARDLMKPDAEFGQISKCVKVEFEIVGAATVRIDRIAKFSGCERSSYLKNMHL